MDRRTFLATSGSIAALAVAGCLDGGGDSTTDAPTDTPSATPARSLQNASFESELEGWTVGKDLPDDPNNPEQPVASDVRTTTAVAADGGRALELEIDGSADDGTIWVQQRVDLSAVEALSIAGYSEQESFNEILKVAAYAGPVPEDGLAEADFDTGEHLADHEGWKSYEYPVDQDGVGLVAVGVSIIWETTAVGVLDHVRLE